MIRLFILLCLTLMNIPGNTSEKKAPGAETKISPLDESKAPNVYMSDTRFIFNGLVISLFHVHNHSYLMFNLELARDQSEPMKSQEDDIPSLIDTLILDLTHTLEVFWDGKEDLQPILQQRIFRVLKMKYKWVAGANVSNVKVQIASAQP